MLVRASMDRLYGYKSLFEIANVSKHRRAVIAHSRKIFFTDSENCLYSDACLSDISLVLSLSVYMSYSQINSLCQHVRCVYRNANVLNNFYRQLCVWRQCINLFTMLQGATVFYVHVLINFAKKRSRYFILNVKKI